MKAEVNAVFFFETHDKGERHPHYGSSQAGAGSHGEMTWMTGLPGTHGAETAVTAGFRPQTGGTELRLTHAGYCRRGNQKTA